MNWQLNDNGYFYNFLSFRSVRDVLILEQNNFCRDLSLEPVYIKHFYELMLCILIPIINQALLMYLCINYKSNIAHLTS